RNCDRLEPRLDLRSSHRIILDRLQSIADDLARVRVFAGIDPPPNHFGDLVGQGDGEFLHDRNIANSGARVDRLEFSRNAWRWAGPGEFDGGNGIPRQASSSPALTGDDDGCPRAVTAARYFRGAPAICLVAALSR